MSPKAQRVSARRVQRARRRHGFEILGQTGSHRWGHPDGRRVVVPIHGGRDIPVGTLAAILKPARLHPDDVR